MNRIHSVKWLLACAGALGLLLAACSSEDTTTLPWPQGPVVSGVNPASGTVAGGTVVTVSGTGFKALPRVMFGTTPASSVTYVTDHVLTCVVPPMTSAGSVSVTVENPDGRSDTKLDAFSYTPWWDLDWARRRPVSITGSSSDQTDFVVEVTLSHDADMKTDFSDIRFTQISGNSETALSFWASSITANTQAVFYVKVPSIPSAGATIHAYYGNSAASSAVDFDGTFFKDYGDTGLLGLWHFDEGAGASAADASANTNTGWLTGFVSPFGWQTVDGGGWGATSQATFSSGSHLLFDGDDDEIDAGTDSSLNPTTAVSLEAWAKGSDSSLAGGTQTVASKWRTEGANYSASTRWTVYDPGAGGAGTDLDGFIGGAFDGRYLYFPIYTNGTNYSGEIARYDTTAAFDSTAAWTSFDPAGSGLGTSPVGFTGASFDGRYVYFVPYYDGTARHGEVLRYDTTADFATLASWSAFDPGAQPAGTVWSTGTDMPAPRNFVRCATLNGKIYFVGGYDSSADDTVEAYDPVADTWTTGLAVMPTPRFGHSVAAANGKIWAFGGNDGAALTGAIEVYDPVTDTWDTSLPPMATPRDLMGCAVTSGRIWLIGGRNATSHTDAVEAFDLIGNAMIGGFAVMPTSRQALSCTVLDGVIYAAGGIDSLSKAELESYDPVTDTWTVRTSMSRSRQNPGFAAAAGKVYAFGGYDGASRITASESYDPAFDTWTAIADVATARSNFGTATVGGKIYLSGGTTGAASEGSTEIYNPDFENHFVDPDGYEGAVFDGRYLYFVPYHNGSVFHGEVLRFDTTLPFDDLSSWTPFTPNDHGVGAQGVGYYGGVFDGRYVYFAGHQSASGYHGEVLRYDSKKRFDDVTSWEAFDPGAQGFDALGFDPDGFRSACFDGRYVYLVPYTGGPSNHGNIVRYDTRGTFSDINAWQIYDPGASGVGTDPDGFSGASFDGRYLYFSPRYSGSGYGESLRFDTTAAFDQASSWTAFDPWVSWGAEQGGCNGVIFDGKYMYFIPHSDAGGHHGEFARFDTTDGDGGYRLDWSTAGQDGGYCGGPFGVSARVETANGAFIAAANKVLAPGTWHHLAMTYDGAALVLYIDGVQAATTAATGNLAASSAAFTIGNQAQGHAFFRGALDEVRVYDRALAADEVKAHARRMKYVSPQPAVSAVGEEEVR